MTFPTHCSVCLRPVWRKTGAGASTTLARAEALTWWHNHGRGCSRRGQGPDAWPPAPPPKRGPLF